MVINEMPTPSFRDTSELYPSVKYYRDITSDAILSEVSYDMILIAELSMNNYLNIDIFSMKMESSKF